MLTSIKVKQPRLACICRKSQPGRLPAWRQSARRRPKQGSPLLCAHLCCGRSCRRALVVSGTMLAALGHLRSISQPLQALPGVGARLQTPTAAPVAPAGLRWARSAPQRPGGGAATGAGATLRRPAAPPAATPRVHSGVDPELEEVLELATDEELELLHRQLHGAAWALLGAACMLLHRVGRRAHSRLPLPAPSYPVPPSGRNLFGPLLKSLVVEEGGESADGLAGRDAVVRGIDRRLRFLAADSKATLKGRWPAYREVSGNKGLAPEACQRRSAACRCVRRGVASARFYVRSTSWSSRPTAHAPLLTPHCSRPTTRSQVLLMLRDKLGIRCSPTLLTSELEAEVFLHVLQAHPEVVGDAGEQEAAAAAVADLGDGTAAAEAEQRRRRRSTERPSLLQRLLAPLRLGEEEVAPALAKLGLVTVVTNLRGAVLQQLGSKLLLSQLRYDAALHLALSAGAKGMQGRVAVQVRAGGLGQLARVAG